VDKVLKDRYLTEFGRRKIYALFHGLKEIEDGNLSLTDVVEQITNTNQEVLLYTALRQSIKKKMQQFKVNLNDPTQRVSLLKELTQEMFAKRLIVKEIPDQVLQKVIRDLYQESVYLQEVLPKMITDPANPLRESFLKESGLDRYYIEELEKEYFDRNRLDQAPLQKIQKNA
jgi:uncharacterized protein (TIGR04442 family)